MEIGISTGCLYPMPVYDSIKLLTSIGFNVFEIFFNSYSDLENDYINKIIYELKRHDAKVVSVHPFTSSFESFLLFSGYEPRFLDGVRMYEMFFRAASRLSAKYVVLHGLSTQYRSALSNDEYCRRFAVLQHRARDYGVTLLQENVNMFKSNNLDFIRNMSVLIPDEAAFLCDTKQSNIGCIDPSDMVTAMGTRLHNIHISDFCGSNSCILPGKGIFNFKDFFDVLKRSGYNEDVIIEVYRFSFGEVTELLQSREYLTHFVYQEV